jgi:Flp pilus assembly protein TadG
VTETGSTKKQVSDAPRGSALIEMLVVVPLLRVIIGSIVDYGRLVNDRAALVESARVAAREAAHSLAPNEPATISRRAMEVASRSLAAAHYDSTRYRIEVTIVDFPLGKDHVAKAVQVTVTAPAGLSPFLLLPGGFFHASASSTFRLEFELPSSSGQ